MCASNTLEKSFDDKLLDNYISSVPATVPNGDCWVCIEGGSEVIIKAMQIQLSITPQLQKRVTAISIDHSADSSDLGMLIHVAGEVSPTPVLDSIQHHHPRVLATYGFKRHRTFICAKRSYSRTQI